MKKSITCPQSGKSYIIEIGSNPESFEPRRPIDYFQQIRWKLLERFGKKIHQGELIEFLRREEKMDFNLIREFLDWINKDSEFLIKK